MSEEIVQFIVLILIGVLYGVVTVLKKVNEWINRQRMRQPAGEKQPPARPERPREAQAGQMKRQPPAATERHAERQPATPVRKPQPPRQAPPAAQDSRNVLLRELAKALTGESEEEETPIFHREQEPRRAPEAVRTPIPVVPRPQPSRPRREVRPEPDRVRRTSSGILIQEAATVSSLKRGHLAVLRTAEDIQRGILVREIFGPPRALRPLRPAESRGRRE